MTPQQFIDAALWFPESVETEPFGPGTLVYKVAGKMFALLGAPSGDDPARVTLKCEPGLALELRAEFTAVTAGYHTDKRHWNTVVLDGTVPDDELLEMLRHSYQRVVAGLRKADRERLLAVLGEDAPPPPSG
ncbi:MmcQ/YjbR family DNA-binding protein [Actinorugispora endophytica]|uniref:Putative DNA-binding protein (MmcQ/YjbR family) n=1 Tax=Actinorugispora endophytica TaxID=1605990 RepID=A0A4R6V8D6_9ACTN|nr:MmcQ/YjbR family DNA-binding protein [Actinorugispora endophytica]TDQ55416.1 putative DNA-binding protein (MmcQ/YjbR family) [Actinorugispora endophytica]